jgi:hypothetical protein
MTRLYFDVSYIINLNTISYDMNDMIKYSLAWYMLSIGRGKSGALSNMGSEINWPNLAGVKS